MTRSEDALETATSDASLARSKARSAEIDLAIDQDPSRFRILTGDRPTGHLHLGHYFGTLRNRVLLQNRGVETWVLVADYQVITDRDGVGPIRERVLGLVADYLAAGIDPERATIFAHSAVPALNQLLLPFLLGQFSRRWTADFMARNRKNLKWLDQGVICLVVYGAFGDFRRNGITATGTELLIMLVLCLVILAFMLCFTRQLARLLGFGRADEIAIVFCGTKKSLATGVPMATVLFAGQAVGLIVFPLMIFHTLQLIACTIIAQRYAATDSPPDQSQDHNS